MSTIIECPACTTRYKMNKPIPEGGRSVKCARCGHQWRVVPHEPEELTEEFEPEQAPAPSAAPQQSFPPQAAQHGFQTQAAQDGVEPRAAQHGFEAASHEPEAAPASHPAAASWEARRGNLAAAIAAMGDSTEASDEDPYAEAVRSGPAASGGWAAHDAGILSAGVIAPGTGPVPFAGVQPEPEPEEAESSAPAWLRSNWASEAAKSAEDAEAEDSVRRALRAALDDQGDAQRPVAGGADSLLRAESLRGAESLGNVGGVEGLAARAGMSRAVFEDGEETEPVLSQEGQAALANAFGETAGSLADPYAEAQKGLSRSWGGFSGPPAETASADRAQASAADGDDASDKFESDIAGIFRQELHSKRSFGHVPGRRAAESDFTDYDVESGRGLDPADDRSMADSPLDADAAALQAALEGSLRGRQSDEQRSGGGGLALAAAWAVFLSVLSGVTLAFVTFRDEIVVALPGTAGLYRTVGLAVDETQIDFGKVNYRWTVADGKPMIEVTGQIINLTDREMPVPRVMINVRDKETSEIVKATATLRGDPLQARETADFALEFISPSKTISQIELAFAEKGE